MPRHKLIHVIKKIALLETALQSVESALEKMQSTTASASMQQPPPPPMMSYRPQNVSLPTLSHEMAVLPAGQNRWMNQTTNHSSIAAYSEPDAMCNFLLRMQQHNYENHHFAQQRAIENHQFAQQRTIERLELEFFLHSRR